LLVLTDAVEWAESSAVDLRHYRCLRGDEPTRGDDALELALCILNMRLVLDDLLQHAGPRGDLKGMQVVPPRALVAGTSPRLGNCTVEQASVGYESCSSAVGRQTECFDRWRPNKDRLQSIPHAGKRALLNAHIAEPTCGV
jgi:hypothetical protein